MKSFMKSSDCAKALNLSLKYFQNEFVFSSGMNTWADTSPTCAKRRVWDTIKFEKWMANRTKGKWD